MKTNPKELWEEVSNLPNVVGVDKYRGKIRVYVSAKNPQGNTFGKVSFWHKLKNKITGKKNSSLGEQIPKKIQGKPVEIIEIGEVEAPRPIPPASASTKTKFRPLKSGISAMHYSGTACTLSGLFRDKKTGEYYFGSNNHCFAEENKAEIGDSIWQPSPYDGGSENDRIGKYAFCVPIQFEGFSCPFREFFFLFYKFFKRETTFNTVDIAFASISCTEAGKCNCDLLKQLCAISILDIGIPIGKRIPKIDEQVQKTGRTTGYTVGKVVSINWTGRIGYSRGKALFTDCILIEGDLFSQGGDSGSPIFDMNGNFIGILFAGSQTHTIVCKYTNIEIEAGMELVILKP